MSPTRRKASARETLIGVVLLLVLAGVAAGMGVAQGRYDPDLYRADELLKAAQAAAAQGGDGAVQSLFGFGPPAALHAAPAVARYDRDTLYQKINGKADSYLSAGFRELRCQRFVAADGAADDFEACVYDMEQDEGAFSVWSRQRRDDAQPAPELGETAYATGNALFVAVGHYYVEAVAPTASEEGAVARGSFARAFVDHIGAPAATADAGPRLPAEGMSERGVKLLVDSVFGFARLDRVFMARYDVDGVEAVGFYSERANAAEAAGLVAAFATFLQQNGGQALDAAGDGQPWPRGARVLEVYGTFSAVWSRGARLIGVHDAESLAAAHSLAARLETALGSAH
jgi:hypothetical protein